MGWRRSCSQCSGRISGRTQALLTLLCLGPVQFKAAFAVKQRSAPPTQGQLGIPPGQPPDFFAEWGESVRDLQAHITGPTFLHRADDPSAPSAGWPSSVWAWSIGGVVILLSCFFCVFRCHRGKPSVRLPTESAELPEASSTSSVSLPTPLAQLKGSTKAVPQGHVLCPNLVVPIGRETKFSLKENMFSWTPRQPSKILNSEGQLIAKVEGTCIGPGDRMALRSAGDDLLCEVQRRSLDFAEQNVFDIFHPHGELFGVLEKDTLLPKFTVNSAAGTKLFVFQGDFRKKEFIVAANGNGGFVAQTGQGFFTPPRGGHYQVRVAGGTDAGLMMVCCLAIDEADF